MPPQLNTALPVNMELGITMALLPNMAPLETAVSVNAVASMATVRMTAGTTPRATIMATTPMVGLPLEVVAVEAVEVVVVEVVVDSMAVPTVAVPLLMMSALQIQISSVLSTVFMNRSARALLVPSNANSSSRPTKNGFAMPWT
jgi:hypothetical protein